MKKAWANIDIKLMIYEEKEKSTKFSCRPQESLVFLMSQSVHIQLEAKLNIIGKLIKFFYNFYE